MLYVPGVENPLENSLTNNSNVCTEIFLTICSSFYSDKIHGSCLSNKQKYFLHFFYINFVKMLNSFAYL